VKHCPQRTAVYIARAAYNHLITTVVDTTHSVAYKHQELMSSNLASKTVLTSCYDK
jgi:hypothetical protein